MTYPHPLPLLGGQPTMFQRIGAEALSALVFDFYADVSRDELLGPVFTRALGPFPRGGWPVHLARIEGFWRSVTHGPSIDGAGAYKGKPGPAHTGLGIEAAHFECWLALWRAALGRHLPQAEAEAMYTLAARMRPTLEKFAARKGGDV